MKNIKIYPKDWLQLHPYKQSDPTDTYYTRIANQVYDRIEQTGLSNSFEKAEVVQISMRMAAYFEDVISGLNIWRSFINTYKDISGKYLPFYTLDDHYYDDEVNFEDVRFLLWHYTQQYHGEKKGTFVNPDNPTNEETARLVYRLFCDEWTTAPENEKMQALFSSETRYETSEQYTSLLHWFHYESYLFARTQRDLGETIKEFWIQNPSEKENTQAIMLIHDSLSHISRTEILGFTSPKWLSIIFSDLHPDYTYIKEQAEKAENFVDPIIKERENINKELYNTFAKVTKDDLLVYLNNKQDFISFATEQLNIDESEYSRIAEMIENKPFALYATPAEGLQILNDAVAYIKDEKNPFYDEKKAADQALSFFIVRHCSPYLLERLEEKGMLADAQTKSLISPERGKGIIHENWQFLSRYFIKEFNS